MILSCKNIQKAYAENEILQDVTFSVDEGEKVAIVGVNGAGKTTLFKIITGEQSADNGEIVMQKGACIGYLAQIANVSSTQNVYDEMLSVFADIVMLEESIRKLEQQMAHQSGAELEKTMAKYTEACETFEKKNGYEYKSRLRGVLRGLGFLESDWDRLVDTLSGGEKTRLLLGKLLLTQPDVLLLDEPTNHLDISAIQWLEDFLRDYKGSVIIISHDRYFLDKVVTKVIDIENKKASVYSGNYTTFKRKKANQREIDLKHYADQQKEIKRQQEIIKQLRSFNKEKSIKRAESKEKLLDKMEKIDKPENAPSHIRFAFEPKRQSGNDVLFVTGVSKTFGENCIFKNAGFNIKKGEKVAIIGPNGVGKTTLIKIILGSVAADSGEIKLGTNVQMAYYDQTHQDIDETKTPFDEISDAFPTMTSLEIRNALAAFVFTADDVFKSISSLSGGERGRLSLAKIMLKSANFLILDEPTNHLDMQSKEILEQALSDYTGTILYISHDRYFINNTATKVLELSKDGITQFLGNYDYYLEKKAQFETDKTNAQTVAQAQTDSYAERQAKKQQARDERRLKNELAALEKEIAEAEKRVHELNELLATPEVYTNASRAKNVCSERDSLEEAVLGLYEKWEVLHEQV